jgi:hypothetical protein
MVEPQFILGRLEAILDRPAMTLDHDQGFDASSNRTPSGEEREVPVSDVAADQQVLIVAFAAFIAGYSVRSYISRRRKLKARAQP